MIIADSPLFDNIIGRGAGKLEGRGKGARCRAYSSWLEVHSIFTLSQTARFGEQIVIDIKILSP
jgi:hypothetical protein